MILSARVVDGRFMDVWTTGGGHGTYDPGIFPHFWSLYERPESIPHQMRLLSNIKKVVTLFKCIVENTRWISGIRDGESLEANIPFMQLLTILLGFKHPKDEPTHAAWDIEMVTAGQFPNFKKDPITELAWWSPRREEVLYGDEVSILEGFNDLMEKDNPDIVDTYNGGRFDWRAIVQRAAINKVRLVCGRLNDGPQIEGREKRWGKFKGWDYTVRMAGRLSFDIWKEVAQDTSLTGKVKNRQLKTVIQHMFPEENFIRLNRSKLGAYTQQERNDYCLSDARGTYMLGEHHLSVVKYLARELEAPLNLILTRSPSHIGNYVYGRAF